MFRAVKKLMSQPGSLGVIAKNEEQISRGQTRLKRRLNVADKLEYNAEQRRGANFCGQINVSVTYVKQTPSACRQISVATAAG